MNTYNSAPVCMLFLIVAGCQSPTQEKPASETAAAAHSINPVPSYTAWLAKNVKPLKPGCIARVIIYDDLDGEAWMELGCTWSFGADGTVICLPNDPDFLWAPQHRSPLNAQRLHNLKILSLQLPDDQRVLPPIQQYLVIQTADDGKQADRVYDLVDIREEAMTFCRAVKIADDVARWSKSARSRRTPVNKAFSGATSRSSNG